jgi:hypothetical protein
LRRFYFLMMYFREVIKLWLFLEQKNLLMRHENVDENCIVDMRLIKLIFASSINVHKPQISKSTNYCLSYQLISKDLLKFAVQLSIRFQTKQKKISIISSTSFPHIIRVQKHRTKNYLNFYEISQYRSTVPTALIVMHTAQN